LWAGRQKKEGREKLVSVTRGQKRSPHGRSQSEKPINLETYNPKDTFNFDDVPALLYKILLFKQFICGPDFPQDIEKGLGEGLMMGIRRYLNSPQVNQLLTPQISDEVKDRVIESVNIFFEDVHEFHI
jgi:hypothetical protein